MMKKLRVGGIDYRIKRRKRILWEDGELSGQIAYHKAEILLSKQNSKQYGVVTLLHEATHAIFQAAGLEQDERLVEVISMGLFSLLRNNPKLVKLIMEVED